MITRMKNYFTNIGVLLFSGFIASICAAGESSLSIPLVDISQETFRQVSVDYEKGRYTGHPSTVLLEDGKTMFCVYPYGHGAGKLLMKRSIDGGLTWSERLSLPDNWRSSNDGPTIYRMEDGNGKKRLFVWTAIYPARMAMSEDDGATWTPLKKVGNWGGIVLMSSIIPLKTGKGHYMALFHDNGAYFQRWEPGNGVERASLQRAKDQIFTVYKSFTQDGGMTWTFPEPIYCDNKIHLCEPCAIRSPDGSQIAVLMRENKRVARSHVFFSNDEGKTWTAPKELPATLTGDRHVAKYLPDGRLFISFRDSLRPKRATYDDWCGWVGTYDDIAAGRDGQYFVRLMDDNGMGDCGYAGVEVLPDGTIVATGYGHWRKGEPAYVISVRFRIEELDAKAGKK